MAKVGGVKEHSLLNQALRAEDFAMQARNVRVTYSERVALHDVSLGLPTRTVSAFIGPSGCGKSTFLRCLNRMNDVVPDCKVSGTVLLNGQDIYHPSVDVAALRAHVGMVFQKPAPFAKSIFDNIAYGPRLHGMVRHKTDTEACVHKALQDVGLWNEVKDRLHTSGMALSGGQQQRLCIARAIAVQPKIILMDEPCSALDPIAASVVEELIVRLSHNYTVAVVTHSMQQARRISRYTAFFYMGHIEEYGTTEQIFGAPQKERTKDYVSGRYG